MAPVDQELVARVREELRAAAGDPQWAAGMQAYLKTTLPCHGVSAAEQRRVLRPLLAAHTLPDEDSWQATVRALWDGASFHEERQAAIALARHRSHARFRGPPALPLYEHLVRTGAWWDTVDDVATHLVRELLLEEPEHVTPVLLAWAECEDLWLRRTAIICQVGTRERCDEALLAATIEANLDGSTRTRPARSPFGREFFIRKAIGWALRDHARSRPEWVAAFVAAHHDELSGLSRREALRHLPPGS